MIEEYNKFQEFLVFKKNISSKKFTDSYFFHNIQKYSNEYENNCLINDNQLFYFTDLISFNPFLSLNLKKYYIEYLILHQYNISKNVKIPIFRFILFNDVLLNDNIIDLNNKIDLNFYINKLYNFTIHNYFLLIKYNNNIDDKFKNMIIKLNIILDKINYPNIILINENKDYIKDLICLIKDNTLNNSIDFFDSYLFKYSILNIKDLLNRQILVCIYYLSNIFPNESTIIKNILFFYFCESVGIKFDRIN